MMSRGVIWIEGDGLTESFFRTLPVPIIKKAHISQRSVRFGQLIVEFERFERGILRL